jgi:hypothetical protein
MQIIVVGPTASNWPAWVQAVGSIIAIAVAIWIPLRERDATRKHEAQSQTAALTAIGERILATVERINRRAGDIFIPRRELPWLCDEADAMSRLADSVDLTHIRDASLIAIFMELQEAARTASRRLSQDRARLGPRDTQVEVEEDRFQDPYDRATRWMEKLREKNAAAGDNFLGRNTVASAHRSDFVLRFFAVAVGVGFAGALARTDAVHDHRIPSMGEWGQIACLLAGLVLIIGSWEGYQKHRDKTDQSISVFIVDTTIVFVYLVTLLFAANATIFLALVAFVFALYGIWDIVLKLAAPSRESKMDEGQ